jgi:hypothetical protein
MKNIYLNSWNLIAESNVISLLGDFSPVKLKSNAIRQFSIPKRLFLFGRKFGVLTFYLAFYPDKKQDRLHLNFGWSENDGFPAEAWQFPHSNFTSEYYSVREFLANYSAITFSSGMGNHLGWDIWVCSVDIPKIDPRKTSDPIYMHEFNNKCKLFTAAYVAESAATVSLDSANSQVKNVIAKMVKDIKEHVFPIFEKKLNHMKK